MRKGLVVIIILILLIAGGYYYYTSLLRLKFDLSGARVASVGLTGAVIIFELRISNPNPIPVFLPSAEFDIFVNGEYLGRGTTTSLTIAPNSDRVLEVPISFSYAGLLQSVVELIKGKGTVDIQISGQIRIVIVNIPFSISQRVSLR